MFITDDFVFVHIPKTGGTFVSNVLIKFFRHRRELVIRYYYDENNNIDRRKVVSGTWFQRLVNKDFGKNTQASILVDKTVRVHMPCSQIPTEHIHKPIVSCIRNPYDRLVSAYEFQSWRRPKGWVYREGLADTIKQHFPHFPDVSFEEFYEITQEFHPYIQQGKQYTDQKIGTMSLQFLDFFSCKTFGDVLPQLTSSYVHSDEFRQQLFKVTFLRTHNLNQDLYKFLIESGYPQKEIEFILTQGKILPAGLGRTDAQPWEKYYTPTLIRKVREQEWLLFELFPEFDN